MRLNGKTEGDIDKYVADYVLKNKLDIDGYHPVYIMSVNSEAHMGNIKPEASKTWKLIL